MTRFRNGLKRLNCTKLRSFDDNIEGELSFDFRSPINLHVGNVKTPHDDEVAKSE